MSYSLPDARNSLIFIKEFYGTDMLLEQVDHECIA